MPELDHRDGQPLELDEVVASHSFHTGLPATPTFAYTPPGAGNSFLGPTIEVQRGTPLDLTVTNKLGDGTEVVHPFAPFFDDTLHGHQQAEDAKAVATAAHLHGGHTPPDSDGGPDDTFLPVLDPGASPYLSNKAVKDHAGGTGSYTYSYPNDQEAAGLWIHDHALGATRLNPKAGLALNYWIRDDVDTGNPDNRLGLPTGEYELPVVLQDGSFNADGTFSYPTNFTDYHPIWAPESFGDVAIVNGKAWPNKNVNRGIYRLRLVNGSNARVYRLTLGDTKDKPSGIPIYQIGSDGGLLNSPVALPGGVVVIAPGERADLLVDFRNARPGQYRWNNNAPTPFPSGPRSARLGTPVLNNIMQFTVGSQPGPTATVPAQLRGVNDDGESPVLTPAATTGTGTARTIMLNEIIDPVTGTPVEALLNNLRYHGPQGQGMHGRNLVGLPDLNTTEVWSIVNTTGDTHPIHLHLTQFRVLDRQKLDAAGYLASVSAAVSAENPGVLPLPDPSAGGLGTGVEGSEDGAEHIAIAPDPTPFLLKGLAPAPAHETGWKDTVMANPGEVVRILVPFGGTAAGLSAAFTGDAPDAAEQRFVGQYVWHCHILEHEENDMMMSYRVVQKP